MIVSKILQLARKKLLEETTEVISDEVLLDYANLVNIDLITRVFTNDKIKSATVTLVSGTGTLPADFGTLYGQGKDTSDNNYEEISIEDFDNKISLYSITVENSALKCSNEDITSINIKYYPKFTTLTSGSTPNVNEYFHECMIYGVLERAFEDLQDEELSTYYKSKYEAMVLQRSAIQSNYEENNQRGGQFFNYQQLI
jgi:hypothetical protein